ncbi:MAG: hypothetical protein ACJ76Y_24840 [Thermoanaerobaculia bacterium]
MEHEVVCVDHGIFPHGGSKIIRFGIRSGDRVEVIEKHVLLGRMVRGERFFVQRAGHKAFLTTGISSQGNTFAETQGDDTILDNLLALPVCTVNDKITFGTGISDPNDVDAGADGGEDPEGPDTDVDQGDND